MNSIEHFNKNHDAHDRFTFGSGIGRAKRELKRNQVQLTLDRDEIVDKYGFVDPKKMNNAMNKVINNSKNKKLIDTYKKAVKSKNKNIRDVYMNIHFYDKKTNKKKVVSKIKIGEKIYKNPYKEIAKETAKLAGALAIINTITGMAYTASRAR